MWTLRTIPLLIAATMVASQGQVYKPTNDLTTAERFMNDVHVVTREVQESVLLQKKAMTDAVTAVTRTKFGILKDLKNSNNGVVSTVVDIELAKLEAIRAAKLVLLNMLASQITTLIDEVKSEDIADLMESPHFSHLVEILLPLFSNLDIRRRTKNSVETTAYTTNTVNGVRTQLNPETAATSEYSSKDLTSSMQRSSSPKTSFPLSGVSSFLQSAGKVLNL